MSGSEDAAWAPGYESPALLRQGRRARIIRATRSTSGADVILKVLPPHLGRAELDQLRELSGVSGVVPLLDAGTTADGDLFVVLPFYPDGSFGELLARKGPAPVPESAAIARSVAAALGAMHGRGLVHNDVCPGNILRAGRTPVLTGFGSVHRSGEALPPPDPTSESFLHSAPEALRGEPRTPASDVYQLASTVWTMLVGHTPFAATDGSPFDPRAYAERVMTQEPRPVPRSDISRKLRGVLTRALSKLPEERFPTAAAFASAFEQARTSKPATSLSGSTGGQTSLSGAQAPMSGPQVPMTGSEAAPPTPQAPDTYTRPPSGPQVPPPPYARAEHYQDAPAPPTGPQAPPSVPSGPQVPPGTDPHSSPHPGQQAPSAWFPSSGPQASHAPAAPVTPTDGPPAPSTGPQSPPSRPLPSDQQVPSAPAQPRALRPPRPSPHTESQEPAGRPTGLEGSRLPATDAGGTAEIMMAKLRGEEISPLRAWSRLEGWTGTAESSFLPVDEGTGPDEDEPFDPAPPSAPGQARWRRHLHIAVTVCGILLLTGVSSVFAATGSQTPVPAAAEEQAEPETVTGEAPEEEEEETGPVVEPSAPPAVSAPSGVLLTDNLGAVELVWTDNSGGTASFFVLGGPSGHTPLTVARTGPGVVSAQIVTGDTIREYCFTVIAVDGSAAPSEEVCTARAAARAEAERQAEEEAAEEEEEDEEEPDPSPEPSAAADD